MRSRHLPRVCRSCEAPMAGHDGTCWRCGVEWAPEEGPRTTLRLIPGEGGTDTDRWTNEGGSFPAEVALPLRAAAASGS